MSKIIGIDLGTTNSVVSFMEGGSAKVIPNQEGKNTTPSIVAFTKDGKRLVGDVAKRQAITNPEQTFYSVKRFIGRKFDEVSKEEMATFPYKLVKSANGDVAVVVQGKEASVQEISAAVLQKLKKAAEDYLGETVSAAVITVPAYFNDAQRNATKDAGRVAGLEVKRIINEPTAAALSYGMDKKHNEIVAVFDFGGGTFDVSILEVGDGVVEVKSTNGDTNLGGDSIDEKIIHWLAKEFESENGVDLLKDKMALQRLKEAAEKAKIELSAATETEINLPYITADASGPKHLVVRLSRAKLESLCADIFAKLFEPCKKALADAELKASDIHEVILVGGSTRIPKIQEMVKNFFGKEPNKSVNPDEVVAVGAAIQGGVLSGSVTDVLLLDVTPLSLGIETLGGIATKIIERNTTIPTKKSQVFSTAEDNQPSVDIHIVQGERELARDNKTLGRFRLDGIPAAPRGTPQIEVTFDIDANGIVHVSAKDKGTGKEQKITISNSSGLSKEEVEKLVQEAKMHEEQDKKLKETIEKRNSLDSLIAGSEKTISEAAGKASEADIESLKSAVEKAKNTLKSHAEDKDVLEKEYQELLSASGKVAQAMYAAQGNNEGQGNNGQSGENGSTMDAEFEEKK